MRITRNHVIFWEQRQKRPSWVQQVPLLQQAKRMTVDALIPMPNARAENRLCAGNIIALLKSVRKQGGSLREYLLALARDPGTVIDPERRAAYAKRWAARIK